MQVLQVSSSTSSFKRWLIVFFTLVLGVSIPLIAASEWMLRAYVLPVDGLEHIARKMQDSSIPNAAFGDSHAAAVSNFDDKDFINLGLGGTTIRQMSERAHYYFSKVKPGKIIIEADSHLFADYRLEAQGVHIPESYASHRLAAFDERHRRFMLDYWERFMAGGLTPKESSRPDQLWQISNGLTAAETPQPASGAQPQPAPATPDPAPVPQQEANIPSPVAETVEKTSLPDGASQPGPPSPSPPQQAESGPAASGNGASENEPKQEKDEPGTSAEFSAFMDYEVRTHTPVIDFLQRDEARIYAEMIDFLIRRGARVCLMTYPVDRFYRERADRIATYPQVKEFYKKLANDRGIPYVSFWSRFDDPEMFQNTDHVNAKGSAILAVEARNACFSGN
jgi:hypothetical protein